MSLYGTYLRLGLHVGESDRAVVRAAAARVTRSSQRDPALRDERKRFYRQMLNHHHDAQDLVRRWRF